MCRVVGGDFGVYGGMKTGIGEKTFMGVTLRLGARLAFASVLALALLLGFVGRGAARSTDGTPSTVTIGNGAAIVEGQTASFTVSLDQPASDDISIAWSASNGATGSLDVPNGGSGGTIQVPTSDDGVPMPDTTLTVTLGRSRRPTVATPPIRRRSRCSARPRPARQP